MHPAGVITSYSIHYTKLYDFVHPLWVWLTVFVGANLMQQAFTGFCPAAIVLNKAFGFQACGKARD